MKRSWWMAALVALVLVMTVSAVVMAQETPAAAPTGAALGNGPAGNADAPRPNWDDADKDGVCDNFVDEDGDGVCDNAGQQAQGRARMGGRGGAQGMQGQGMMQGRGMQGHGRGMQGQGMMQGRGMQGQGRGMHQGQGQAFVDADGNGICDHAE